MSRTLAATPDPDEPDGRRLRNGQRVRAVRNGTVRRGRIVADPSGLVRDFQVGPLPDRKGSGSGRTTRFAWVDGRDFSGPELLSTDNLYDDPEADR
ncbi:hypothetical protein [Candidatus Protofrankia californiensis]|uniref:hypothetical protein n=1 Tax=Candidatus Protofrankia californiensis TaxID=1839754 RepID=UPI0010410CDB|nr:hypothetical protein [Candidatus Protofrankia californiensis]